MITDSGFITDIDSVYVSNHNLYYCTWGNIINITGWITMREKTIAANTKIFTLPDSMYAETNKVIISFRESNIFLFWISDNDNKVVISSPVSFTSSTELQFDDIIICRS